MSFAVKGTQYRVSTPNLESVKDFPYVFKWTALPDKTIAISRVVVTLVNPLEKGETDVVFSVFTTAESFSRTFHSISDLLRVCDHVESQTIAKASVSKFYFDIKPPLILTHKNDRIELHVKKKRNLAQETFTMCEGLMSATEGVTVKEIMRPTIEINEDAGASEALNLMIKRKVGYLLVRRKEDLSSCPPSGIVTETDLLERVLNKRIDPKKVTVKDIMTSPLITIDSRTGLDEAIKIMLKKNVKRLPVLEKGKIIGIVIDRDIVRSVPIYFRGASKKRIYFPE